MKTAHLDKITRSFETQAPLYNSEKLHLSKQEYLDLIVEKTAPKSADAVLDVAAGTCVCGRGLAPLVSHVVCLDATLAMLETGRKECERLGIHNMTFIKGYAEELPFLDHSFDIVISRLAFHHFIDVHAIFEEMVRVLKPGGKLVMVDMTMKDESLRDEADRIERLRDDSHVRDLSLSEMRNLYAANRLSLQTQEQTDIPVCLDAWMELTRTPKENREEIRLLMKNDLDRKRATGFFPYLKDGSLYFDHIKEQSLIQKQPSKSEGCFSIYARKANNIRLSGLFLFSGDLAD